MKISFHFFLLCLAAYVLPGCFVPVAEHRALEARFQQTYYEAQLATQREAHARAQAQQAQNAALQSQMHANNVLTDERVSDLKTRLSAATTQVASLERSGTATREIVESWRAYVADLERKLAAHDQALVELGRVQKNVGELQGDVNGLQGKAGAEEQHKARVLETWQQRRGATRGGVQ